jgi:hypothetical protein
MQGLPVQEGVRKSSMEARLRRFALICAAILSTGFFVFIAILFALPHPNLRFGVRSVAGIALGIGLVWACVSTWARIYVYESAGQSPQMKLFPGTRPTDPVALRAWRWHWQFYVAFVVILSSGAVIAFSVWLQER